jgi:UPF0716 protein FxsA
VVFVGVLLFVAAEIVSFVLVAEQIGFLWAAALLVAVSALGPFVVRRVGLGALAHTRERLGHGELPTRALLDGLVVLVGGFMICVPGFVGDAIGLVLMIGPVRQLLIRFAGHWLAQRAQAVRPDRWQMVNVRSQPRHDGSPPSPGLGPALGPGDGPFERPHPR